MNEIEQNLQDYEDAAQIAQLDFSQLTEADFDAVELDDDGTPYGMVMGVPVAINQPREQYITGSIQKAPQEPEGSSFGEVLGDVSTALNAPFAEVTRGVMKAVGNAGAAFGLVDQADVDRFFATTDEIADQAMEGNPTAKILGTGGAITGQYVLPAVVGYRALLPSLQAANVAGAPIVASIISESLVGLLGISPNDENVFNLIKEDTSSPAAATVREFMATDPADGNFANRARNAAEALAVLGGSEALVRNLPRIVKGAKDFVASAPGKELLALGAAGAVMAPQEAEGGPFTQILRQFKRTENDALRAAARDTKQFTAFKQRAAEVKATYPTDDGWVPIEATGAKIGKKGEIKVSWRQPAYEFNKPPRGVSPEEHLRRMTEKTVRDVGAVVERARGGDARAQEIINQARWYRDMRSRLRAEFGGLGDTFADLLGATSAQTGVEQNWRNSIEILRRFTRGEYDDQIKMYMDRIEAGEPISPTLLQQLDKAGEFDLIKSAAGKLFNTNSPAATGALLDMFRQVKAGSAPKTINFTGNLIGYSSDATIDVWAARYLRDAAGLPRIPPPAEKAVGGKHLTGSTLDDPRISGEFKFGQEVFAGAADEINRSNIIKNYDTDLGDLGPDDLQALVWFLEKEKWAKNNWTTKAGEGGSLDFEASLAGAADPAAVLEARRTATATFEPPKKRKRETDEEYAVRVDEARTAFDEQRVAAEQSIEEMAAPLERTVLGVARERPGAVPTNVQQAELASELTAGIADDSAVVAFQTNNTYGEFMGELERSLNAEFVTRSNFDPSTLTRNLVKAGKKYDQDAVFISKVLREPTERSRPGVEIYFTRREGVDMAQQITAMLREKGVDGFTFITDARQMDRVDVQAAGNEATAGLTGIRFQYIPEFDDAYDAARHAEIVDAKQDLFEDILNDVLDLQGVAQADVVHYDTKVFRRATDTDWMTGGETYDAYLGSTARSSNQQVRQGQPAGGGTTPPDRGTR